jgi:tetratricopeptide (TPR) repeat protein
MFNPEFLSLLGRKYSQIEQKTILRAILQDPIIESYVNQEIFVNYLLNDQSNSISIFKPANIAANSFGLDISYVNFLSSNPVQPVKPEILQKANDIYQRVILQKGFQANLENALLVSFFLRESFIQTNTWKEISRKITFGDDGESAERGQFWSLVLACLKNITPDSGEFYGQLLIENANQDVIETVIHSLLVNPSSDNELQGEILKILGQQKIAISIRFLDLLNKHGFHEVVSEVARNLISLFPQNIIQTAQIGKSLQSINWINADDLAQKIQYIAVLNAFAGEKEKATELIGQVKEILNRQNTTLTKIQEELTEDFQSHNLTDQELISPSIGLDNENNTQSQENSIEEENYLLNNSSYKRIRALISLSDFIEAEKQLTKLKQNRKSDPELFYISAEINIHLGGFQEALNDLLIAQSLDPSSKSNQQLLARAYFYNGEYSKAFELINTLYKSGKEFSNEDIYEFCEYALRNNKPDFVSTICEEKISAGKKSGIIFLLAAESCFQKNEVKASLDYLKNAIELDKANPKTWLLLAKIEKADNDNEKALEALFTGKKYAGKSQEISFEIIKHNFENGNDITNETLIEEIINAPLVSVTLTKEIIHFLNNKQKGQSGLDLSNRAIEKWPKNIEMAVLFAELLVENGSYLIASRNLESIYLKNQLDTHSLQVYLFSLLQCNSVIFPINAILSENDLQKVSELMALLSKIYKDDFWTRLIQAELFHLQKNNSEAFDEYRKLLMDLPKIQEDYLWRVQVGMGQVLIEIGQTDTAIALLSEALNQAPSIFEIHQFIADAYRSNGLEEKALQIANRAIETFLDNPLFIQWYAKFVSHLQEKDNAIEWLKEKINSLPNSNNLNLLLASVELEMGNKEDLAKLLEVLAKQSNLVPSQMQLMASIYTKNGDYPQAIDILNRSLQSPIKENKKVLFGLACLHRQQSNYQESEKALTASLINSDEINLLNLFLAEIYFSTHNLEQLKPILVILEKNYFTDKRSPELSFPLIKGNGIFLPEEWKLFIEEKENLGIFLAKCFLLMGEIGKSLVFAEKALEINPMNLALRKYCAELASAQLMDSKADQLANIDLRSIKDKKEDNEYYLELVCLRAELSLKRGEDINAASLITNLLQGNEKNSRLQCLQSRLLNRQGDFENSVKFYEKAKNQIHQMQSNNLNLIDTDISALWFIDSAKEIGDFEEASITLLKLNDTKKFTPALLLAFMKMRIEIEINEKQSDELMIMNNRMNKPLKLFGATQLIEDAIVECKNESSEFQRWHSLYKRIMGFETSEIIIQEEVDILAFLSFWYRKTNNIEKLDYLCQKYSNNPDVHFQISQALMSTDPAESKKHLNEAVSLNTHNPYYFAALAFFEKENSDPKQSLVAIEQALNLWPNELNWQIFAADMAEINNDSYKIQYHTEKAYEIDPQNQEIRSKLIKIYFQKDKFNDAAKLIKKKRNNGSESFEELIILAKAALNCNNFKETLDYANKAGKINTNSPIPLTILSALALKLNKLDKSIEYANQAIENDPKNVEAHLVFAKIIGLQKDGRSALEYLESISKRGITDPTLVCEIASLREKLFGTKAALEYLLNYKELNNEDIMGKLAGLELEMNNITEAESYALSSLSINPYQANLKKLLGQTAQKKGNLDQAVKYYTEAISCEPENGERYLDACEIHLYRREAIKALEVIELGMKTINNDWRLYQKAGKIYWEMKEYIKAETILKQAYEMNPSDQQLKRQLNALTAMIIIYQNQEVIL